MSDTTPTADSFDDGRLTGVSFRRAVLRDCDLTGLRIVDSKLTDVYVSGYDGPIVVNDVDVTAYVEAELDRRYPERVRVREMRTVDDLREMWRTIRELWTATVERARRQPAGLVHERVDGEWSFVETMRHLVFATDAWARRSILDEEQPFDPYGYPATGYPDESAEALGLLVALEPAVQPSLDEILAVRAERMAAIDTILSELTDDDLVRSCERPPAPGYPSPHTVRQCLGVVMNEEVEHHRYATRDLATLDPTTFGD